MATIAEIRQQYPQYNDLSDTQLADSFHSKFYSDIPKDQFYSSLGIKSEAPPTQPAQAPAQPSTMSQLGRQLGLTARAGITGATAIPAMMAEPIAAGVNAIAGRQVMASPTQGVQNLMTAAGLPEPQGDLERAVQAGTSAMAGTGAQAALAQQAGKMAAPLAANLAQQIPAAAAGGMAAQPVAESVGQVTESPLAATIAGMAVGSVSGGMAGRAAGALTKGQQPTPVTLEDIKGRAQRAYTNMENQGVEIKPKSVLDTIDNIQSSLVKNNFNPKMDAHKPVAQLLEQFKEMTGTQRVSFTKLEQMRSAATDLKGANDPATRKFAGQVVSELDNYLSSLGNKDIIAAKGSTSEAIKSVQDARKDWRNLSRAGTLEDVLNVAEARKLDPKTSESELIRRGLINLAADKRKMSLFNEREQNAIKSVAKGPMVDPLLSLIARFNPQRSQLVAGASMAGMVTNPATAGIPIAGFAADKLQSALRTGQTKGLISDILNSNVQPIPPNYAWRGMLSGSQTEQPQ